MATPHTHTTMHRVCTTGPPPTKPIPFHACCEAHQPVHRFITLLPKLSSGSPLLLGTPPCLVQRFPDHAQLGPCCSKVTQGLVKGILSELASQGGLLLRQSTGGGGKQK